MQRPGESIAIHIRELAVRCHHGVTGAEREVGQRLLIDARLEPVTCAAVDTDDVSDTVDYVEACELVARVATQESHGTLERVAGRIADELFAGLAVSAVRIWIRKPAPPLAHAVGAVGIELERRA